MTPQNGALWDRIYFWVPNLLFEKTGGISNRHNF